MQCKSGLGYHCAHSSTLTKDTNEPPAAKWYGNFLVLSLSIASQVRAKMVLLPLCLPFLKSFTGFSSQISRFNVHILQVTVLRFLPPYATFTFSPILRASNTTSILLTPKSPSPFYLPDIYSSTEDLSC